VSSWQKVKKEIKKGGQKMEKKHSFPLSYESDGVMGKKSKKRSNSRKTEKNDRDFFNTTPSSE
jgi:hypothetical protein